MRGLVVTPMPHLHSVGGDGTCHARARLLQVEGWGAALELSSEPHRAGGSGGLGCHGGLGPKGSRPDLPQELTSLVAGRSLVMVGLGVGVRGDPGEGPHQDAGDPSPPRVCPVSAGAARFPRASGRWGHGNLPLTSQDAAPFRAEPSPSREPELGYSVETTEYPEAYVSEGVYESTEAPGHYRAGMGPPASRPLRCFSSANLPFPAG